MNEGNGTDSSPNTCGSPHCKTLAWPTLIKKLLDDVVNINCIKSQHWRACLFNSL